MSQCHSTPLKLWFFMYAWLKTDLIFFVSWPVPYEDHYWSVNIKGKCQKLSIIGLYDPHSFKHFYNCILKVDWMNPLWLFLLSIVIMLIASRREAVWALLLLRVLSKFPLRFPNILTEKKSCPGSNKKWLSLQRKFIISFNQTNKKI